MKRIIAYAMTEAEMLHLNEILKDIIMTDSYLIGTVSEKDYRDLQKEQFIMKLISEESDQTETEQSSSFNANFSSSSQIEGYIKVTPWPFSLAFERNLHKENFPDYYVLELTTTLINEYKNDLEFIGIEIVRYLGDNKYVILVKEDIFDRLLAFKFIKNWKHYNEIETGVNIFSKLNRTVSFNERDFSKEVGNLETIRMDYIGESIVPLNIPAIFDVLVHRKEDMPALIKYMEEMGVRILGISDIKARVELRPEEAVYGPLPASKYVQTIEQYIAPRLTNDLARKILNIDSEEGVPTRKIDYEGDGQIIGIADTGIDETHPAFLDQIVDVKCLGRPADGSDPNGHGTHVAGSIVGTGAGSDGSIRGSAPKAKIYFQSILKDNGQLNLPVDLRLLFQDAFDSDVRIHNNSWGAATKSRYTSSSVEVDDFVYSHKDMLIVFSAGNDGKGKAYRNVPEGYTDLFSLGSPATAKNALTIGASRSTRSVGGYAKLTYGLVWQESFPFDPTKGQKISGNAQCMAAFSSRGPVDDERRVKPDLVAPGTDIASAFSKDADLSKFCGIHPKFEQYAIMCGTSMSAPLVTGCAAIVREYYQKVHSHLPSAALLKATLINSASKLNEPDANFIKFFGTVKEVSVPHYHQGFGLVNMMRCIPGTNADFKLAFDDGYRELSMQFRKTGQRFNFELHIQKPCWIRMTMAYTDPPGRGLQHNLVLLANYTSTGQKWAGNHELPRNLAIVDELSGVEIDLHNNVQTIHITDALPGVYNIQVVAHSMWQSTQDFALVVTSDDKDFIFTKPQYV